MSKKSSKHIKNKKQNNKGYKKIAFVVIFILIVIIAIKNSNKVQNTENTQIIINNNNVTKELQNNLIKENDKIYMSFEDIQKFIDNTIYKEDETGTIITTSPKKLATLKTGEDQININGASQKEKDIVIEKNDKDYIAISELENVYDYEFKYIPTTNIATIDSLNKKMIKAYTKKTIKIKEQNNLFSKNIEKVEKGNWLVCIEQEGKMTKIRTQNGNIGYVQTNKLNNFVTEREDFNLVDNSNSQTNNKLEYDISKKDISTFEKRQNIINLILQEAIKNDKMYVKMTYNGAEEQKYDRFKIEITPILSECGIKVEF